MATYGQWRASFEKNGPARCTWVCGPEHVLADEALSAVAARITETGAELVFAHPEWSKEQEIWDLVLLAPQVPWSRAVWVSRAGRLRKWEHLRSWLDARVPVWLVLQADEDDFPRDTDGKLAEPASWLRDSSLGQIVRCSPLDAEDAAAWACRRLPGLTVSQAGRLLARASGDLREVANVLDKARLFGGGVSDEALRLLCEELPGQFADLLVLGRMKEAMHAAESMGEPELHAALGLLASRLSTLALLHKADRDKLSVRDVVAKLGVSPFLVQKFSRVARDYGEERIARSWLALAVAEDAVRSGGARYGVAEALVLSW